MKLVILPTYHEVPIFNGAWVPQTVETLSSMGIDEATIKVAKETLSSTMKTAYAGFDKERRQVGDFIVTVDMEDFAPLTVCRRVPVRAAQLIEIETEKETLEVARALSGTRPGKTQPPKGTMRVDINTFEVFQRGTLSEEFTPQVLSRSVPVRAKFQAVGFTAVLTD